MKKILTLVFFVADNKILLGYKKRGFGKGRWNGFGGKVESGETIESAAIREGQEECGLAVLGLEKRAIHQFSFSYNDERLEVHTFLATHFTGSPKESEEMKPEWFPLEDIPYQSMWPDDILWLPQFLAGKYLATQFHFGDEDKVLTHAVKEVTPDDL